MFFISIPEKRIFEALCLSCSELEVGEGSRGEDELVESAHEGSHEGVGLGDINLTLVVQVVLGPGSGEELSHVGFHFSLGKLFGDEHDLGASFLAAFLVEDFLAGLLASSVGNLNSVVIKDVVHDIILIGTEVSGRRSVSGNWWWVIFTLADGNNSTEKGDQYELHVKLIIIKSQVLI